MFSLGIDSYIQELQNEIHRLNDLNLSLQNTNESLVEENKKLKERLSSFEGASGISIPQPPETSEEDKVYQDSNRSYRDKVAFEIMQTGTKLPQTIHLYLERVYVKKLTLLIQSFLIPLQSDNKLIDPKVLDTIFSNIEEVVSINNTMLQEIELRVGTNWSDEQTIGNLRFNQMAKYNR